MGFKGIVVTVLAVLLGGSVAARAALQPEQSETQQEESSGTTGSAADSRAKAGGGAGRDGDSSTPGGAASLTGGNQGGVPTFPEVNASSNEPEAGPESSADSEGDAFTRFLPFLTEASLFGLLGFALGYTSRKIVKIAMIFLALIFGAILALQSADLLGEFRHDRALELLNGLILNVKQNVKIEEHLMAHIPSAGTFIAGYFLGFRKG